MFGALNIPASALVAQRERMVTIASNMAMADTPVDPSKNADNYRRRIPIFAPGDPANNSSFGVHLNRIMYDDADFKKVWDPDHPLAYHLGDNGEVIRDGYVRYSNVNSAIEQMNMLEASRAYEANITVAEASKSMMNAAIRLLA
jgi:flagellar basal-body rod protein FlgC